MPRAIKLFQAIYKLADLNADIYLTPINEKVLDAILVLRQVVNAFIEPFILPDLSLRIQLIRLSKCAHLLFALHRLHGGSFMSNALYADLQSVVKTIFFCVAKQKELDDSQAFYLYQIGTDRLEQLFGEVRTTNHDPNVDAKQLGERLASALAATKIFMDHPEWKRTQRRLSYNNSEGSDHVNPRYFTSDLAVSSVCLATVWKSGRIDAEDILNVHAILFNFEDTLAKPGVDFLRPNGGDHYVGIGKAEEAPEEDRSIPLEPNIQDADVANLDGGPISSCDGISAPSASHGSTPPTKPEPEEISGNLHLDDFLDDQPDTDGTIKTSDDIPNDWMSIPNDDGIGKKVIHKASVLSHLFCSALGKPSADRLRRVRGYTREFKAEEVDQTYIPEESFHVQDPAICAIRVGKVFCPVIVTITRIQRRGNPLDAIAHSELDDEDSNIEFNGQVLVMEPVQGERCWMWTGEYGQFTSKKSQTTSKQTADDGLLSAHAIKIPSHLVSTASVHSRPVVSLPDSFIKTQLLNLKRRTTYLISEDDFDKTIAKDFESLEPTKFLKLKEMGSSTAIPYKREVAAGAFPICSRCTESKFKMACHSDDTENRDLVLGRSTTALANKTLIVDRLTCRLCDKNIKPDKVRNHVGEHILLHALGETELELKQMVRQI